MSPCPPERCSRKSVSGVQAEFDSQPSSRAPSSTRSSSSSKPGARAERTSQGTSTSTFTRPAAGRGDMRDQGTLTTAS